MRPRFYRTLGVYYYYYTQPIELKAHINHIIFSSRWRTGKKSVRLLSYKYIHHIIRKYFIRAMIYTREYVNVHIIIMHRLFARQNTVLRWITILYELCEHKTRRVHKNFPNFFLHILRSVLPSLYTTHRGDI